MKNSKLLFFFIFSIIILKAQSNIPDTNMWITNGTVYAIEVDDENIYIGGSFTYVGPKTGHGAYLYTSSWKNKKFPEVNGPIYTIVVDENGSWYIGGQFSKVGSFIRNNIALINSDGSIDDNWNPNCDGRINTIAIRNNEIFVGGRFNNIGGKKRNNIAKLNNTNGASDNNWNARSYDEVYKILSTDVGIYVAGGLIDYIGGKTYRYLAKLDTSNGKVDTNFYPQPNAGIRTIAIKDTNIYVGGYFTKIGGLNKNKIAKLHSITGIVDENWNPNPSYNTDELTISSITIDNNNIYVGGCFSSIGGLSKNNLAKLNNTTGAADENWSPEPNCPRYSVKDITSIAITNNSIFVGGDFTHIGLQKRNYIAKLDKNYGISDSNWNPFAGDVVNAIAIFDSNIYIGGNFSSIGGIAVNNLAKISKFSGQADSLWNPYVNGSIFTIAMDIEHLFVGGYFTNIDGFNRNFIAKLKKNDGIIDPLWDPSPNYCCIEKIIYNNDNIYVVGLSFTNIGGLQKKYIAKLNNNDGSADILWDANVQDGGIRAMAMNENNIFIGGDFTKIEGQNSKYIAKLLKETGEIDTSWDAGTKCDPINSIAIFNNDIYIAAGFKFLHYGCSWLVKVDNITGKLNSNWKPRVDGIVYSITNIWNDVYIGGSFLSTNGKNIAKLDNSFGQEDTMWHPYVNNTVRTIVVDGSDIYIGGDFNKIGDLPQSFFARFQNAPVNIAEKNKGHILFNYSLYQNYPNPFNPITNIQFSIPKEGQVRLKIYNILGQELEILVDDFKESGNHIVTWDASNYPSGVYIYKLETETKILANKMLLLK
ncbi:MAG: T9SS type A sorting domain-containing protein [Ignavibacteriales bacterium]|nr:T9SS type A sorting domain-containing protein [Ignavibacteriales bacterium]